MNIRAATTFVVLFAYPTIGAAADLTITDICSSTMTGAMTSSGSDPLISDSSGNTAVTGFASAPYTAGIGNCDTAAGALCTLSASKSKVAKGSSVTLFAKCTQDTTGYVWSGPVGGPALSPTDPSTSRSVSLTFPSAGAYTYTVKGTKTGSPQIESNPVTILVGDASDKPNCVLTLSPASVVAGATAQATIRTVCQPEATSYTWEAEAGAPAAPSSTASSANLTFATPGTFTYKVVGVNSAGDGPKASATVNVGSASGCSAGPVEYDMAAPAWGTSTANLTMPLGSRGAFSFSTAGNVTFNMENRSDYVTYPQPDLLQIVISQCKGDFTSVPSGTCNKTVGPNSGVGIYISGNPSFVCVIQPNVTYYMNIRTTACSNGSCGLRVHRTN